MKTKIYNFIMISTLTFFVAQTELTIIHKHPKTAEDIPFAILDLIAYLVMMNLIWKDRKST